MKGYKGYEIYMGPHYKTAGGHKVKEKKRALLLSLPLFPPLQHVLNAKHQPTITASFTSSLLSSALSSPPPAQQNH